MNDFADWFSPIVVKELRQGMRSRAFVGGFLLVQLFMIFCVLASLQVGAGEGEGANGFFWTVTGVALLVAMPFRGLSAVNGEIKGNTLELLLLTQLSAWRIVAGKWAALVLQSLLLVCAMLPYVVVRYFLGGIDLVGELTLLGWFLLGSALCTALMVGLSPFAGSVLGRAVMSVGFFMGIYAVPLFLFSRSFTGGSSGFFGTKIWIWTVLLMGPLVVLEFLETAVGKIAPVGENHATRKGLLAIAIIAVAAGLGWAFNERNPFALMAAFLVAPVCFGSLMEDAPLVPSLYKPLLPRRRWLALPSWLTGRFLHPGWAPGLLFTLGAIAALVVASAYRFGSPEGDYRLMAVIGAIFMPLALVRVLLPRRAAFPCYFGFQLFFFVLALVIGANAPAKGDLSALAAVPTIGLFLQLWNVHAFTQHLPLAFALTRISTVMSLLVLFLLSIRQWRTIGAMEREIATMEE